MSRTKTVCFAVTVAIGIVAVACDRDPEQAKRKHVERGDKYAAEKKYAEAIVEYRSAVAQDDRFGDARYKLAKAYALSNDPQNALRELVRAADLMPENASVQLDAARALLLAGRFEDASTRVEAVLKADPKSVDAHILRGNAMAGMRDFESAGSDLEKAIELAPTRSDAYVSLAGLQIAKGRTEQAEAAFKQAIAVNPKAAGPHLALANFYGFVGRAAEAEESVKRALEIEPRNGPANRLLAMLYIATNRASEAERPLLELAASGSLQSKLALADYYTAQRRPQDARKVLNELAEYKEAFAASRIRIAGIEYESGQRTQAHALVDQLLAQNPNHAQVIVVKGGWLLAEKKFDQALARAQAAVKADPSFPEAHALLASVHAARGDVPAAIEAYTEVVKLNPRTVYAQIELARLNLRLGRASQALPFAEQAAKSQPTNGAARVIFAAALLAHGETDRAEAEARLIVNAAPKQPEAQVLMGQIQYQKKDHSGARRSFERALELDPNSIDALNGLVQLDVAARQIDQARRRIDAQLAKGPATPPLLLLAARTSATGGDLTGAESLLRRAIAADASFLEAYGVLGQLYVMQGKLDEARQEYERIVTRQPKDVTAQTMVGKILQIQGKASEAQKVYERVLEVDPRAVEAANNLAYMHAEAGTKLDLALNLAQTAKAERPDDPDVNDTLGWVYYKRGLASLALETLHRSVEKNPSNAMYHYHLGLAYLMAGDKGKARAALERALKVQPNFDGAADARKTLAAMKG